MSRLPKLSLSVAIAAVAFAASPVLASSGMIAGIDVLKTWNLVVLGDLTSSSEVEGRTFVGGNLDGNSSNYQITALPASSTGTPGLTVVGDVNGGHKNLNNGSGAIVGGNVNSGLNLNGAAQTVQVGGTISNTNVNNNTVTSGLAASNPQFAQNLAQQKSLIETSMEGLSHAMSTEAANSQLTISGNRGTFNAQPGADGVAVFNISAADLDKIGEIQFNLNGADTAIVNVSGKSIRLDDNFLGGTNNLGEKVVWNFHEAADLSLTTAWGGSVLAPGANATTSNYIQGSAVFGNLVQNGEMHVGTYTGGYTPGGNPGTPGGSSGGSSGGATDVPEPGMVGLFALGLGALLFWRRRRAVTV
ncbi:choice-of-anchor A family protein [Novosphingobium lindaniclasticum]|uniref:Glycosyltransferase family 1 n=1 Tax=Novosphingobium lindaniclasticum LE124 TaxID=1096930 RepID=T0HZL6_9SPHN|nr:choice-of-anchor A family protein [Novosphingobium lindaniclasticum]EQB18547.1 glycosyltransferase family 1 [Novosphingobium lindaniclasticum LE124]